MSTEFRSYRLKLANQLFRAGKTFKFFPIANCTHGPSDPETSCAVELQIAAFFRKHLLESSGSHT